MRSHASLPTPRRGNGAWIVVPLLCAAALLAGAVIAAGGDAPADPAPQAAMATPTVTASPAQPPSAAPTAPAEDDATRMFETEHVQAF